MHRPFAAEVVTKSSTAQHTFIKLLFSSPNAETSLHLYGAGAGGRGPAPCGGSRAGWRGPRTPARRAAPGPRPLHCAPAPAGAQTPPGDPGGGEEAGQRPGAAGRPRPHRPSEDSRTEATAPRSSCPFPRPPGRRPVSPPPGLCAAPLLPSRRAPPGRAGDPGSGEATCRERPGLGFLPSLASERPARGAGSRPAPPPARRGARNRGDLVPSPLSGAARAGADGGGRGSRSRPEGRLPSGHQGTPCG